MSGFNVFDETVAQQSNNVKVFSTNPEVVSVSEDAEHELTYKKPGKARIVAYDADTNLYALSDVNVMPAEYKGSAEEYVFPKIDGGNNFNIALKADGSVWTWGANDYGQLGVNDNTVAQSGKPVPVQRDRKSVV